MQDTTWVEVSRDALRENYERVSNHAGVPVCAVVKANAYGHGIVDAARVFASAGAAMLGVTRIEEARALRDAGVNAPILAFTPPPDIGEAVSLGVELAVASREDIERLPAGAVAHLKVDTGMGRLGVGPTDAVEAAEAIARRASLGAVWTHFADAAGATGRAQLDRFNAVLSALRHHGIDARAHAANSAATLALPGSTFSMVRVGTLLYGQDPPGARAPWQHAETFTWYARVVAVRSVDTGTTVGYGSEWRAKAPQRIATLAIGYADGYTLEPNARTPSAGSLARSVRAVVRADRVVYFGEQACPVIGRVGMQAITVAVRDAEDVAVGSVARIPARRLSVSPLIERVYR